MRQLHGRIELRTSGRGLVEITGRVREWTRASGMRSGLVTLFIRHTSASLLIQENADPDVGADLERYLSHLVPDGDPLFGHVAEGSDDMPAHVRAALTQTQLAIPLDNGGLLLGTWQGIYLYEHRRHGHVRELALHIIGE